VKPGERKAPRKTEARVEDAAAKPAAKTTVMSGANDAATS